MPGILDVGLKVIDNYGAYYVITRIGICDQPVGHLGANLLRTMVSVLGLEPRTL